MLGTDAHEGSRPAILNDLAPAVDAFSGFSGALGQQPDF